RRAVVSVLHGLRPKEVAVALTHRVDRPSRARTTGVDDPVRRCRLRGEAPLSGELFAPGDGAGCGVKGCEQAAATHHEDPAAVVGKSRTSADAVRPDGASCRLV